MAKRKSRPGTLANQIIGTRKSGQHVDVELRTSQRILARITDGIYRQPASAIRELISNAYDADATKVTILTDAPRFSEITIRDNGIGFSANSLEHLIQHIGGSAKRTREGKSLEITSEDPDYSPKGRKLIGKMGIGLFAVAQFTRHFLIITKCKGDKFRTIADITLGKLGSNDDGESDDIKSGDVRIWSEPASNPQSHGTEVKLLELLPRTQAELCSIDRWGRIDFEIESDGKAQTPRPIYHIGRMDSENPDELLEDPKLPWTKADKPEKRFQKFVSRIRGLAKTDRELVDLDSVCDNYLQMLWTLSLACPLEYIETHPFDLTKKEDTLFFQLENKSKGQAQELDLKRGETSRKRLDLLTPRLSKKDRFEVFIDGVRLARPILFTKQPKTSNAIKHPLMFIGKCREEFAGSPVELSGGPLEFEAYLFWTPKVLPKQHQGVALRVGNAAGAPFDRTFMSYQVSEQTRLRQITAEIFVHKGLDGAINLDRETFNFSHAHYQYLVKWLHSALRQLTNKNKAIGKEIRQQKLEDRSNKAKKALQKSVSKKLSDVGVDDVAEVQLIDPSLYESVESLRDEGIVALRKDSVVRGNDGRNTAASRKRDDLLTQKATAITQLLYGWGLLDDLSFEDQELLVRDILEIAIAKEDE